MFSRAKHILSLSKKASALQTLVNVQILCQYVGGGEKGSFNSWHMLTVYCGGGRGTIILKNNRLNIERS